MSLDIWLTAPVETEVVSKNITHNLNRMWHEAGVYKALYESEGKKAEEVLPMLRFITLEVDKIIEKKKFEEYPELLGVHHYPELKDIDFLSQEQLIELDKELAHNRGTNVSFNLKSYIHWDLHDKVYDFLIEKGIIKKEIHVVCSCGRSEWLSRAFDEKFKEQWIEDLKKSNSECEAVGLLTQREFEFFGYCEECEEYYEFGNLDEEFINDLHFHHFYVKIKERDKRWDNI